jgi:hypothetical protein
MSYWDTNNIYDMKQEAEACRQGKTKEEYEEEERERERLGF